MEDPPCCRRGSDTSQALCHLPPVWVKGKGGHGKGSGAERGKGGMTQSCCPLDKGAMGDVQESSKKHQVGRRAKGREAEWLWQEQQGRRQGLGWE